MLVHLPLPPKLVAFRSSLVLDVPLSTKQLARFVGGDKNAMIFGLLSLQCFIFVLLKHMFARARSLIVGVPNNTHAICSYPYTRLGALHVRLGAIDAEILSHYKKSSVAQHHPKRA